MKDDLIIKITLERLDADTSKINDLIRTFVYDLNALKGVKVSNHSQIKSKWTGNQDEKKE